MGEKNMYGKSRFCLQYKEFQKQRSALLFNKEASIKIIFSR